MLLNESSAVMYCRWNKCNNFASLLVITLGLNIFTGQPSTQNHKLETLTLVNWFLIVNPADGNYHPVILLSIIDVERRRE